MKEKDGIKSYKQEIAGSSLLAFRGEAVVQAPLARVASVLFDAHRAKEWMDDLNETVIVKWFSEVEFLEYDHMAAPVLIQDRDFVSRVTMLFDQRKSEMSFVLRTALAKDIPAEYLTSKYVRGDLDGSKYTLSPTADGRATLVIGEVHADPKGALPKWLVNFFQKDWPVDTLVNLRKQCAKENISNDPKIMTLVKTYLNLTPASLGEVALNSSDTK